MVGVTARRRRKSVHKSAKLASRSRFGAFVYTVPTIPLYGYPAGSWGPEQADTLLAADGHAWRYPCKNLTSDDGYCEL